MKKTSILVVEDETELRQDICDVLRDVGYHILEARNGKEGLRAYAEYGPRVIITDIFMPEIDGIELISTIRKTDTNIPIIALSAAWEYLEVANLFGANKTFYKPLQSNLLLDTVQTLLVASYKLQETTNPLI